MPPRERHGSAFVRMRRYELLERIRDGLLLHGGHPVPAAHQDRSPGALLVACDRPNCGCIGRVVQTATFMGAGERAERLKQVRLRRWG